MAISVPTMQELLEAGVHFGHQVRRGHPKMSEYIFGVRDGVHVINLEHSERMLAEAAEFARSLGEQGKILLFVGTKKQAQPIVKELAQKIGCPYVDYRWVGGVLTNFEEIRKNTIKLLDLKDKQAKGQLSHYTKKEQLLISRRLEKFECEWGGISNIEALPEAIFLADCVTEKTALAESRRMGITIIGIADTNCNPLLIDYPIPGNDDATKSIRIITSSIADAYAEGMKQFTGKKEADQKKKDVAEAKEKEQAALAEV